MRYANLLIAGFFIVPSIAAAKELPNNVDVGADATIVQRIGEGSMIQPGTGLQLAEEARKSETPEDIQTPGGDEAPSGVDTEEDGPVSSERTATSRESEGPGGDATPEGNPDSTVPGGTDPDPEEFEEAPAPSGPEFDTPGEGTSPDPQ